MQNQKITHFTILEQRRFRVLSVRDVIEDNERAFILN